MPTDRLQHEIAVGNIVNVPATVTAIGGTTARPTVQITTKYAGFDGNTDTMTEVDCIQVVKDNSVPNG